jgi:glycosyltransferase involved in cell wall biosynthesis
MTSRTGLDNDSVVSVSSDPEGKIDEDPETRAVDLSQERRLRVLISAFACGPNRGSEPGTGWNWVMQAARHHDVWVLTSHESRGPIEATRQQWGHLNVQFLFWNVPGWPMRLVNPLGLAIPFYYYLWQVTVVALAARLHRQIQFDVIHHVTFGTVEVPGFLWLLRAPFIWGPVGGAQLPPRAFRRQFGWRWIAEEIRILRKRLVPFNPVVRLALRKAKAVLAANAETWDLLERSGARHLVRESDVGVNPETITVRDRPLIRDGFVVLWAGTLKARKGPFLALDAIAGARSRGVPIRFRMAGDGPLRNAVDRRINELGLRDVVEQLGEQSYAEMTDFYDSGNVFLFTSLQDTAGTVVLEAMAHGLPVITLDHQGVANMVDSQCGTKVAVTTEQETVDALISAIERLSLDPESRMRLGRNARARVERRFSWNLLGARLRELYARSSMQTTGGRSERSLTD